MTSLSSFGFARGDQQVLQAAAPASSRRCSRVSISSAKTGSSRESSRAGLDVLGVGLGTRGRYPRSGSAPRSAFPACAPAPDPCAPRGRRGVPPAAACSISSSSIASNTVRLLLALDPTWINRDLPPIHEPAPMAQSFRPSTRKRRRRRVLPGADAAERASCRTSSCRRTGPRNLATRPPVVKDLLLAGVEGGGTASRRRR